MKFKIPVLTSCFASILLTACAATAPPSGEAGDGTVRMYAFNNKQQLIRQSFTKDTHIAGCHELRKEQEIHRVAQFGYAYCQVFSSANCQAGTEVAAYWNGGEYRVVEIDVSKPQKKLYRGGQWILAQDKNVPIQSWACYYE